LVVHNYYSIKTGLVLNSLWKWLELEIFNFKKIWYQNQMKDSIQNPKKKALQNQDQRFLLKSIIEQHWFKPDSFTCKTLAIQGPIYFDLYLLVLSGPLPACSFYGKKQRDLYMFVLSWALPAHSFYWEKAKRRLPYTHKHTPPKQNTLERNLSGMGKSINRREWWEVNVRWTHPRPPWF